MNKIKLNEYEGSVTELPTAGSNLIKRRSSNSLNLVPELKKFQ